MTVWTAAGNNQHSLTGNDGMRKDTRAPCGIHLSPDLSLGIQRMNIGQPLSNG